MHTRLLVIHSTTCVGTFAAPYAGHCTGLYLCTMHIFIYSIYKCVYMKF